MSSDRPYNVLVAEDESYQRLALLDILTLCDYEGKCCIGLIILLVTAVENGKKAFEMLQINDTSFDLVLLDLYMPEMDGFELLSIMQEDERLKKVPVVVMSANDTNDIIASCLSKADLACYACL